jgi:hypothetical protein
LVLVAVLALTLSACGGDEPASEESAGGAQTTGAQGDGSGDGDPDDSAGAEAAGGDGAGATDADQSADAGAEAVPATQVAAGDLSNFSCEQRRGVWTARGDVSNSGRQPMVYTLTVVTVAGSEIAGDETERVLLEPGEATTVQLPAIGRGPADACTPRLTRTPR